MQFTVTLERDGFGNHKAIDLFPSATTIENMSTEPRWAEVRVTYEHPNIGHYEVPEKVADSLIHAWPDQVDAIMKDIRPCIGGFYGFNRWGMFVGVEPDGYIHT